MVGSDSPYHITLAIACCLKLWACCVLYFSASFMKATYHSQPVHRYIHAPVWWHSCLSIQCDSHLEDFPRRITSCSGFLTQVILVILKSHDYLLHSGDSLPLFNLTSNRWQIHTYCCKLLCHISCCLLPLCCYLHGSRGLGCGMV